MKTLKSQNYYEILNISRYASQEEIRKAYEICKHTFQGDSLATYTLYSEEENQEIFGLISEAYETLRNPSLRREYDTYLSSRAGNGTGRTAEEQKTASAVFGKINIPGNSEVADRPSSNQSNADAASSSSQSGSLEGYDRMQKFADSVTVFDGAALKKARHLAGCSLDELSEQTKIRKTYLENIEEENYESLPASVYVKGFVIILANTFGLPSNRVAQDYMSRFQQARD